MPFSRTTAVQRSTSSAGSRANAAPSPPTGTPPGQGPAARPMALDIGWPERVPNAPEGGSSSA